MDTLPPSDIPADSRAEKPLGQEKKAPKSMRVQTDKIADINTLFSLYRQIKSFLETEGHHEITQETVTDLLKKIAKAFYDLKRNNDSYQHIRNRYGKMDHSQNQKNNDYIDFEKIALLHSFPNEKTLNMIYRIIYDHNKVFFPDLHVLANNILFILNKELLDKESKSNSFVLEECKDLIPQLTKRANKSLVKFRYLQSLFDIQSDHFFLEKMCEPLILNVLSIDEVKDDTIRYEYSCLRVLTLLGETVKSFSDTFRERYSYLHLITLGKLRDKLSHQLLKKIGKETFLEIMSNMKNGLYKLQNELKDISSRLPDLDKVQTLTEALEEYEKPLKKLVFQIPKWKELVERLLDKDGVKHLSSNEISLLRARRTELLEEKRIDLLNEHNQAKQLDENSKTSPVDNSHKDDNVKKRCQDAIDELESKKKFTSLDSTEEKKLAFAKKTLKNLENKHNIGQQPLKKYRNIGSIEEEQEKVDQELQSLSIAPEFTNVLKLFKVPHKEKKTEAKVKNLVATDNLTRIVQSLENEIHLLKKLDISHQASTRDFAREHCISVIGQFMRDLEKDKNLILTEIFEKNETIKQAFKKNIYARNSKVMHDPLSDHTSYLNTVILNETMPLLFDVKALNTILDSNSPEKIEENVLYTVAKVYTEIGFAYNRLNMLSESEKYFQSALDCTSEEYYTKFHLESLGLRMPENYHSQVISYDLLWVKNRLCALDNLGGCQLKQKKYKEAAKTFEQALKLCNDDNESILTTIQSYFYISTIPLVKDNEEELKSLLEKVERLASKDKEVYANVLIHYAYMKYEDAKSKPGHDPCPYVKIIEILEKVNYRELSDRKMAITGALIEGLLCNCIAQKYEEFIASAKDLPIHRLICPESIRYRDFAIKYLTSAFFNLRKNYAQLKSSWGDSIRVLAENTFQVLPAIMGTQAERYLRYESNEKKGYDTLKEALTIQKHLNQDTSRSYQTLGFACETLYEKTRETKYLEEGLTAYSQNINKPNDQEKLAMAFTGKARILFALSRTSEAIINCLEAQFYYSQFQNTKTNEFDQIDQEFLDNKLRTASNADDYRKILTEYEISGDNYQVNGEVNAAKASYQKCLLGLQYLEDTAWRNKVQLKKDQ